MTAQSAVEAPFGRIREMLRDGSMPAVLRILSAKSDVAIACHVDGYSTALACGQDTTFTSNTPLAIGCIAKTLTAMLTAIAVSEGRLSFSDTVAKCFPRTAGIDPSLRIHHLLNQSHGLDGSAISIMPQTRDGFVDADAIWRKLREAPALGEPGAFFYNFENVGSWIIAALLEGVYGVTYRKLLNERILVPLEAPLLDTRNDVSFPVGGDLPLSGNCLLQLCRWNLGQVGPKSVAGAMIEGRSHEAPVPPWPPLAEGSSSGWLRSGTIYATYGHLRNASALMAVISPAEGAALVVSARRIDAIYLAQRMLFPSAVRGHDTTPPRPLTRAERQALRKSAFVGRYQKASHRLDIDCSPDGELAVQLYERRPDDDSATAAPIVSRKLMPAVANTFYAVPPESRHVSYVRFHGETPEGTFEYATTGKHVFRRG